MAGQGRCSLWSTLEWSLTYVSHCRLGVHIAHSCVLVAVIMAKGIASGFPLAAIAASKDLSDHQTPGAMGGTYGGNAVGCAAAIATLQVFEEEGLVANAAARGDQLQAGLRAMQAEGLPIREVRGAGLMTSVALEANIGGAGISGRVSAACQQHGLLLLTTAAPIYESLRFIPPLTVSETEMDQAMGIFREALVDVAKS